jgi:hypothetical protein
MTQTSRRAIQRHKKMQQAGYYDENKSQKERLSIV